MHIITLCFHLGRNANAICKCKHLLNHAVRNFLACANACRRCVGEGGGESDVLNFRLQITKNSHARSSEIKRDKFKKFIELTTNRTSESVSKYVAEVASIFTCYYASFFKKSLWKTMSKQLQCNLGYKLTGSLMHPAFFERLSNSRVHCHSVYWKVLRMLFAQKSGHANQCITGLRLRIVCVYLKKRGFRNDRTTVCDHK